MQSLGDHLYRVLSEDPDRVVVTYATLDGAFRPVRALELTAAAQAAAFAITGLRLPPRSLIGIAQKSGISLHAAWLGTIWAGHVPTMIAPPSPRMEARKFADGFQSIVTHLGIGAVVIDGETRDALGALLPAGIPTLSADAFTAVPAQPVRPPPVDPDAEVVVQHTSGTTGAQKAIGFTSRHIFVHAAAYAERLQLGRDDVIVSWLPLYHDMGFIACFVTPLILRIPIVELSPFDWVQKPSLLFDAIDACGGTFCWLPNFAFKVLSGDRLLATAAASGKAWRLGRVRAFINCSEPVTASAIDQFVSGLAAYGVRRDQVIASYAMAENLFAVTQNELGSPHERPFSRSVLESEGRAVPAASATPDEIRLVSNGRCLATTMIEVRDTDGRVLPEGVVGQFHVEGSHRFNGYRRRPDLTAEAIDDRGFYATGDLGFILDHEIYVTGRLKDLLIIRGRNYYPHDIEELVGEVEGVNPGRVAAFSVPDETSGTEKLVIMVELLDGFEASSGQIALAIRKHVAQSLDCAIGDLRIVPPRKLVKSTSGKVARADNRRRYLEMLTAG